MIKFAYQLSCDLGKTVYARIKRMPNVLLEMHECAAFSKVKDIYDEIKKCVYGCASFKNDKNAIIGNLRENTLKEIWNSEKRITFKESLQHYYQLSNDYGGCTAATYSFLTKE